MGCEKELALNFVIAHSYEARPIIDYYQLSKDRQHSGYNVFTNNQVRLIVSGQGKLNAAAATAYMGGLQATGESSFLWVNIGTAGHRDYSIASLWRANKVTDEQSGRSTYPVLLANKKSSQKRIPVDNDLEFLTAPLGVIKGAALMTVESPTANYAQPCLYDMEASGFFQTATRFESLESIVSFKVVSDNLDNPFSEVDKTSTADLIRPNIATIDKYLRGLNELINFKKEKQVIEINDIKLTFAQSEIVNELIGSLTIHGVSYHSAITQCKNPKQLIAELTKILKSVELLV